MKKKKTHILFVYHSMKIGGVEKELLSYVHNLSKAHSIHLALSKAEGELMNKIPSRVKIHILGGNSYLPDLVFIFRLAKIIKQLDITHVVGFMIDINLAVLVAHRLFSLSSLPIICEQIVLSQWMRVQRTGILKKLLVKSLYKRSHLCLCQSQSILEDLETNFNIDRRKLVLIPSYHYFGKTHERHYPVKKKDYFLYVGRIVYEKNIHILLEAFSYYKNAGGTYKLVIIGVGDKNYQNNLETRYADMSDKVSFFGYLDNPTSYYQKARALILPSLVEGRSRVLIEAMHNNCLIVCSNFPGHQKYIRNLKTGVVFRMGSVPDLTNRLEFVANNQQSVEKISRAAKKKIDSYYSGSFSQRHRKAINQVFLSNRNNLSFFHTDEI